MRLRRPIAFILSAAVAASALTGCDSFSGHAAAAANSAQVQQLIEFIADLGLERDLRQALQKGGDLRQALLTLLGLENAVNFNVDDLAGARPGQHAVQVWEVTAQSAEDAAALAASQIRAVLEQLKSNGVTAGRIGMVEVDGKYYVVVDVEVTEENTFEPIKPASNGDDDSDDDDSDDDGGEENSGSQDKTIIEGVTKDASGLLTIDVAKLELSGEITANTIITTINENAGTRYNNSSIKVLDLSGCTNLTTIGQSTFERCSNLTSIDLSNTKVTTIPHGTFLQCYKLAEVKLPKNLETIAGTYEYDNGPFERCKGLREITFYNVPTTIGKNAFYGVNASGLTVYYPSSWDSAGNNSLNTLKQQLAQGGLAEGTYTLKQHS